MNTGIEHIDEIVFNCDSSALYLSSRLLITKIHLDPVEPLETLTLPMGVSGFGSMASMNGSDSFLVGGCYYKQFLNHGEQLPERSQMTGYHSKLFPNGRMYTLPASSYGNVVDDRTRVLRMRISDDDSTVTALFSRGQGYKMLSRVERDMARWRVSTGELLFYHLPGEPDATILQHHFIGPDDFLLLDGGKAVATLWSRALVFWQADTAKVTSRIELPLRPEYACCGMAASTDQRWMAISQYKPTIPQVPHDSFVEILDCIQRTFTTTLSGHKDRVTGLAFLPDSRRVVSASADGRIKVWDVSSGQELHSFVAHDDPIACLALSRDGTKLASADVKGVVRIWDATRFPPPTAQ